MPVDNFVQFIEGLSDQIVGSLEEGAKAIQKYLAGLIPTKGVKHIHSAIEHYKNVQLERDVPMQQILAVEDALTQRVQQPLSMNLPLIFFVDFLVLEVKKNEFRFGDG